MVRFTRKSGTSWNATNKGVAGPRESDNKTENDAAPSDNGSQGAFEMNATVDAKFTPSQVAKHNKPDDLWIIVKGKVYDVTTYLPVHQGGDAILKYAGKDATKGVYGPQHPSTVPKLLERYCIGDLISK